MNWDDPAERLALVERVGVEAYNKAMRERIAARPPIYTVCTQFGVLFAVKGTKMAFSTRAQAEAFLAKEGK